MFMLKCNIAFKLFKYLTLNEFDKKKHTDTDCL